MPDNDHSIATYVSDMLALERHIRIPFETQAKDGDFKEIPQAGALATRFEPAPVRRTRFVSADVTDQR
jgi:hypothetical protein